MRGLILSSALALAGCASMAAPGGQRFDASALSEQPSMLVATTRKPVPGLAKPWFGTDRGRLTVARARLKAPAEGRFSLASVGLDSWSVEGVEPAVGDVGELITSGPRDVLVYVHGFKTTFETAALDAIKLSDGIRFRGETMVFSWPSKAGFFDYGYDRESAMWSRDAFERVLDGLMTSPNVGRVHIVAHSMGTGLTIETLRQLHARYGESAAGKIGAVILASPDIDMNVFASSVERIGSLAQRITVISATNDRALALSGKLAGGITRVGAAEKAELERLGLRVIDASSEGWGIINHDLFLSSTQVRQVIRNAIDGRPGLADAS